MMNNYIDFRGARIHYRVHGNGPAIVLLHGFLGSGEIWKGFVRRLKGSFTIISVDLPGHGKSDPSASLHSLDMMADAIRQLLKKLEINACIMVGHSMGGYLTLAFADLYPRLLKGFVLFHSHAAADSPEALANRDRTIALVEKDHHGFIKSFIPDLFHSGNIAKFAREIDGLKTLADSTPKEGIINALQAMRNRPDRQHVLVNSKVPVLFIIGKNDKRIPMEIVIPQTLLPAHSEVLLLDQVGHMGFIEASGQTCDAIRSFAERMS